MEGEDEHIEDYMDKVYSRFIYDSNSKKIQLALPKSRSGYNGEYVYTESFENYLKLWAEKSKNG